MGFTVRGDLVLGILFSFCYGIEELFIDFVAAVYYKDHRFFPSFVINRLYSYLYGLSNSIHAL